VLETYGDKIEALDIRWQQFADTMNFGDLSDREIALLHASFTQLILMKIEPAEASGLIGHQINVARRLRDKRLPSVINIPDTVGDMFGEERH